MKPLHKDYRDELEKAVLKARRVAEAGARAALDRLGVGEPKAFDHVRKDPAAAALRNALRAKARSLGDARDKKTGRQDHRPPRPRGRLRALAPHALRPLPGRERPAPPPRLRHHRLHGRPQGPGQGSVDLGLPGGGARADPWTLAASFAASMLPQIFRQDDPALALTLAPEHQSELEALVEGLHPDVFDADDSLGWVYQYWQKDEKDRVNKAGQKITGDTLPAVTQLFTEHYMVAFLIDNTIGAWWAGKAAGGRHGGHGGTEGQERGNHGGTKARRRKGGRRKGGTNWTEDKLRDLVSPPGYRFDYLRFMKARRRRRGSRRFRPFVPPCLRASVSRPSCLPSVPLPSGTWLPRRRHLRRLAPRGQGPQGPRPLLRQRALPRGRAPGPGPLRIAEEGLDLPGAIDAVLRDNLHGLELDARCTQIAAFNVALTAWRLNGLAASGAGGGGWKPLPRLKIACTGQAPNVPPETWLRLVRDRLERESKPVRDSVRLSLADLHARFTEAPTLGSLIQIPPTPDRLGAMAWEHTLPYLDDATATEYTNGEADDLHADAVASAGIAEAARLLQGPDDNDPDDADPGASAAIAARTRWC